MQQSERFFSYGAPNVAGDTADSAMPMNAMFHPLPLARHFVDREAELATMREFWTSRRASTLMVWGLGGIGKTALVARFLEELQRDPAPADALLVWSLYEEPDVDEFVHRAELAVGVPRGLYRSSAACRQQLFATLATQGHALIVLDGAENASRSALAALLDEVAATDGTVQAIVTTRTAFTASRSHSLALGSLSTSAATEFLDRAGVPPSHHAAALQYGGYPLSLELLAALIRRGEEVPASAPREFLEHPERPLTALLKRIDAQLSAEQRELVRRIALLRDGARLADLAATYPPDTTSDVQAATWQLLARNLIQLSDDGLFRVHPIVRSYALQTWGRQIDPSFVLDLLDRGEPRLPAEKAALIAEMLENIQTAHRLNHEEIAKLQAQLSPDAPHSARAYSALLEAALRLTNAGNSKRRAFLSYVREDADTVAHLRRDLEAQGIDVWQDIDRIGAGKRWKDEIRNAIQAGDAFIACFSPSFERRSRTHMNEELLIAVDELRKRPRTTAWFVSVRLGPCEIPELSIGAGETLRDLQWVDLCAAWPEGVRRISRAILGP